MSDPFAGDKLIRPAAAGRRVPGRQGDVPVHAQTVVRWILRGARSPAGRRVYLEAVRCGSSWLTSEGALARFMAVLTDRPG